VGASLGPRGAVKLNTPVRVAFDQPVDHGSAESHFQRTPAVEGSFAWSGNTMTFTPRNTGYQTSYTFTVAPGVAPSWGLPSAQAFSSSYITENQVIKLKVPAYKQAFGRSCELSALRMLLAYRGINVSDWDLLMKVGYAPRARDKGSNSWENPNQMFVGNVNTSNWSEGYGVHAGPVAAAGRTYGRNTQAYYNISAAFIAGNIHAGNPVEFYGHISAPRADSWNTTSGVVQTTTSMHGRVVTGVVGSASNPVGFYINDPWTGGSMYWTAGQLMANMNAVPGVSNQAVVVY
jgi:uncharacterized protein YvpB